MGSPPSEHSSDLYQSKQEEVTLKRGLLGVVNLLLRRSLDKYHNYRGVRADICRLERKYHFGYSLVFVRGPEWPDYASAFPFNRATFDREVPGPIYARELGPESTEHLRAYYANRPAWILAGPTETRNGFEVVQGPLPLQEVKE